MAQSMNEVVSKCAARDAKVAGQIKESVTMANNALECMRGAAIAFVKTVNPMGLTSAMYADVVKHGKELYKTELANAEYLKAHFGNVALLALAADMPISFEVERTVQGVKGKAPVHTTGTEATKLSKNDATLAAKAVREDIGTARAEGGGRTPRTPSATLSIFSLVEFKAQLKGLFTSSGAVEVVRNNLKEYGVEVLLTSDLKAKDDEIKALKSALVKAKKAAKK
jgi:hypothetical protein|tara:strand:- start:90 stop:764 length:675 start_codon:yes stop_codon:yes gene_type:complete